MERKIVEMLVGGSSIRRTSRTLGVGKERVRRLREQAREHGYLDEEDRPGPTRLPAPPQALFPDPLDGRALQRSDGFKTLDKYRDWIAERLQAGWHMVTVLEELPEAVKRSAFYRYLDRESLNRIGETYRRVVPEIVHRPGEALILDWGKLRDVIDPVTGQKRTVWMYTGVLGFSRYTMVRLVWDNKIETTLEATASMFAEIGGVTMRATSDNPKCFALQASKYDPLLNPAIERFASHYGFVMECLPPRDPQKKGKVERTIPYVRRLYEAHGDRWEGIEESQTYLDRKMAVANARKHGTTMQRPIDRFKGEEKPALRSLPALAYEIERFSEAVVRQDGHARFENKYYSLDERYIGRSVQLIGNSTRVAIYHDGKLLETHERVTDPNLSKSTKPQHLKPWERAMSDDSVHLKRATKLGPNVAALVRRILRQGYGFVDTRKIWGVLSLDKSYAAALIDEASRKALAMDSPSFRTVKGILEAGPKPIIGANLKRAEEYRFIRPLSVYGDQLSIFEEEGNA